MATAAERAANVCRAGELMAERRDRLAELVTLEMGKLICSVPADAPIGDFAG